jgi:hypothetical protein
MYVMLLLLYVVYVRASKRFRRDLCKVGSDSAVHLYQSQLQLPFIR